MTVSTNADVGISVRAERLFSETLDRVHKDADRFLASLMVLQWVFGVAVAMIYWRMASGNPREVYCALLLGGALGGVFVSLALFRTGHALTRHVGTVAYMLWPSLLAHISGGRMDTSLYVFGSLVFLASYRDWKILLTTTALVVADHVVQGTAGLALHAGTGHAEHVDGGRVFEHAFWVLFEEGALALALVRVHRDMRTLASRQAEMEHVTVRTQELVASWEQYRALVETARAVPWHWDAGARRFSYVGPQGAKLLGCPQDAWLRPGFLEARLHPDDRDRVLQEWAGNATDSEFRLARDGGAWVWVRNVINHESDAGEALQGLLIDVTDRHRMELELRQAQKLESVGRLASGVAHEINTPIQFVSDSVQFLDDGLRDLFPLLAEYRRLRTCAATGSVPADDVAAVTRAEVAADVDFLAENMPKAIARCSEGLTRVTLIVRAMKELTHPDAKEKCPSDINRALSTTLTVASNEYKYVADVETHFSDLPPVLCHISELNQVFLNLFVNAAHAIDDVVKSTGGRGAIRVTTKREDDGVVVLIADTGAGIPEAIRDSIFDPFFTTKEVGKGTGQGLAIARNVVVEKHGGTLTFESEVGRGTTFRIWLPLGSSAHSDGAVAA